MIISITPNPALDISYFIEEFKVGNTHRVKEMVKTPGGKGINVAKVLKILGEDIACSGFLGGANGEYIQNSLKELDIKIDFTKIQGETRSAYAINDTINSVTTEIREQGPFISKDELDNFFNNLVDKKNETKLFTCSGSLPKGLDSSFFDTLLEKLQGNKVIIDTSEAALKHIVFESKIKPYAIKPNIEEINQLLGYKLKDMTYLEILKLEELKDIEIVVISLGKNGCIAKFRDKFYQCEVPTIKSINPVGSGDASIAGLSYGIKNNLDNKDTLRYSMACGVLNALEEKIGHINIEKLEDMLQKIKIKEL